MTSVVDKMMKDARKHSDLKEGIASTFTFLASLNQPVGSMLAAYPPAAIAWSGICTILSVSMSSHHEIKALLMYSSYR